MMAVHTPPGGWHRWVEDAQKEAGLLEEGQPRPSVEANVELLLRLTESRSFEYGGYVFRVPPVPFELGLRLHMLKERYEVATATSDHSKLREIFLLSAKLFKACVRPRRWDQRIVWRLLPINPFERMSNGEFLHLMTFFLASRMISNIRVPSEELGVLSTTSRIPGANSAGAGRRS